MPSTSTGARTGGRGYDASTFPSYHCQTQVEMSKKELSEADICHRYITPAIHGSGWIPAHIRMEYPITDGQIIVRGNIAKRKSPRRADYVLFHKPNVPIAVVEAKDNKKSVGAGMQQALDYAGKLDVPFVFSSNGDAFQFRDLTGNASPAEVQLPIEQFPTPEELWQRYRAWRKLDDDQEALVTAPDYTAHGWKNLRYYQQLAVNRTVEAVSKGQTRCLLAMATGTGKTLTAFQIIHRLWKSRKAKRILFLADRNILVDQAITNDFRPFGGAMKKLNRSLVDKETGKVDTSYEIYLSLYQAIVGGEDRDSIYDKFDPDFFDLIVIDECHRGSARADSEWRSILEYFDGAVQLGLTATPKETQYVSNIHYFGESIYTYSLKQGIEDGFLAPFKVVRVDLDVDLQGWRPTKGQRDDAGELIEDRIYNQNDFDRNIVFPERTKKVAERVSEFLHGTNPMDKSIVFCEDIDHAERMRLAIVNVPANKELVAANWKYVMRITGDENEGKAQVDNFINPKEAYPVIATTSKLLTTGVDAQTCKLIVLDRRIGSMTEFKQIIGRGTRLREDFGKMYFTILDFRKATDLFADPDWDGPPLQDGDFDEGWTAPEPGAGGGEEGADQARYVVGDQEFTIFAERVQFYNRDGKLVTESLKDYTRKTVAEGFISLNDFLRRWNESERKQAIVSEMRDQGVFFDALADLVGPGYDAFDLVCHVAFDQSPLTRRERADKVRRRDAFTKYGDIARAVLDALLEKYADQGVEQIEEFAVLQMKPISELGTPVELVAAFGGRENYLRALSELEAELYAQGAA
jgi:type I restriction enzyme, R subunit